MSTKIISAFVPLMRDADGTPAKLGEELSYESQKFEVMKDAETKIHINSLCNWFFGLNDTNFTTDIKNQKEVKMIQDAIYRIISHCNRVNNGPFIDIIDHVVFDTKLLAIAFPDNYKMRTPESNPFYLLFTRHEDLVAPATVGTSDQRGSLLRIIFDKGFPLPDELFMELHESAVDIAQMVYDDIDSSQVVETAYNFIKQLENWMIKPFVKNLICKLPKGNAKDQVKYALKGMMRKFKVDNPNEFKPLTFPTASVRATVDVPVPARKTKVINPGAYNDQYTVMLPSLTEGEPPKLWDIAHDDDDPSRIWLKAPLMWFTGGDETTVLDAMEYLADHDLEYFNLVPGRHPFTRALLERLWYDPDTQKKPDGENPFLAKYQAFINHPEIKGNFCALFSPDEVPLASTLFDDITHSIDSVASSACTNGATIEQLEGTIMRMNKIITDQLKATTQHLVNSVPDGDKKDEMIARLKRQRFY